MIDLNQLAIDLSAELFPLESTKIPEKTGKTEPSGNGQVVDTNDFSRVSRFPGPKQEVLKAKSIDVEKLQSGQKNNGGSIARIGPMFGQPGNPGNPGNANRANGLFFPFLDLKTGKREIGALEAHPPSPILPDTPDAWLRDGGLAVTSHCEPCPGFGFTEWRRTVPVIVAFFEEHAEAAHALGWTAVDLFGVHPVVGVTRVDCCGALMVAAGEPIRTVEKEAIVFRRSVYRRRPLPESIPVWEFQDPEAPP